MSTVHTNICRWGDSHGIRLPQTILDIVGLGDNDEVSLTISNGSIIISRAENERKKRDYPTLAERFSGYTGDYMPEEWETGSAVGEEF